MLSAPVPEADMARLAALRAANCAYAPREERFDRITRTARRLLQVPMALISIVEQDEQWFRSVQGVEVAHTPRDISFCGHLVALNRPFCVPDTWQDPDFSDNPLVTGPPGIRSYLGWPLQIAVGVTVGALCVMDTMPRTYGAEDFEALSDLAGMTETELKVNAPSLQNRLLMRLSAIQRKAALDPLTGCWNIRGFRELLALGYDEARANGADLGVCHLHVNDLQAVAAAANYSNEDAVIQLLAQVLRQRLPRQGAMARLGQQDFCVLVPSVLPRILEQELARLTSPRATVDLPGSGFRFEISLSVRVAWLVELGPSATLEALWAFALTATRV